ncbi:MAG: UDP-3-O-(3-hydroxymyristoyl)glucosamine N-acyltransferase [Pseudomonadales bacterium]
MAISLTEISERFGLEVVGDGSILIEGIAALDEAKPGHLTFLFNPKYRRMLEHSKASAVVVSPGDEVALSGAGLIAEQPRLAWARIASLFDTSEDWTEIHPSAVIDPSASLGQHLKVGPNAVIRAGAKLGDGVSLGAGVVVGEHVVVGQQTQIHSNVVLYHAVEIGKRCIIHANAVIGADGFGFEYDRVGHQLVKIPQVFSVQIEDDVEIGAGTTIDRGALSHTVIGASVKIDNQVQIGHGSKVGSGTVISGATAIAGSTKIGNNCMIGGAVGIIDNIEIADQVEITAMSLVSQSITKSGRYSSGTGLMPGLQWKRNVVVFKKLDELYRRIRKLES